MKIFSILLIVSAIAFADTDFGYVGSGDISSPASSADGTLYEQPYDFPNLSNGIFVNGPQFAGADNFTLAASGWIRSITFWTVFSDPAHPFDIAVELYFDNSGVMGSLIWGETVPAAYQTETLTGDTQWGLDLWRSDLQLQMGPIFPAGDYWLAMSVLGSSQSAGWLVCDPTYPPDMYQYDNSWGTVPYDGWFGLYDHDVAISRTTWGNIKNSF
jgi:hypothetical protein